MALGRIDYYVLKPWCSADELFHRTVAELVHEWSRGRPSGGGPVTVVGQRHSSRTSEVRSVLTRNGIPHAFHLAETDEGRSIAETLAPGAGLPVIVGLDGRTVSDPTNEQVAEACGLPTRLQRRDFGGGGHRRRPPAARHARQVTLLGRSESLAQGMSRYLIHEIEAASNMAHNRTRAGSPTPWRATAGGSCSPARTCLEARPARNGRSPGPRRRLRASVPGLFAVGDVRHRSVKRVASAVGDGAVVVAQVHEHLDRESGAAAR
jgi:hypothetical protein